MGKQKSVVRGILAGMAGGLAAAWVMNEFMAGPGQKLEEKGGHLVDYPFGALTGGLYGALAEYSTTVTSGFGTSYGGVLFSTADFLAVPVGSSPGTASPFAARIVYGATTEFVRRILRNLL
jgi:hypothetical protein